MERQGGRDREEEESHDEVELRSGRANENDI